MLVRLVARRGARVASLFAVAGPDEAMELVITLRRPAPSLEAADVFFDAGVTLVERVLDDVRLPLQQRAPCYDEFRRAWQHDPWLPRYDKAFVMRRAAKEDEVMTMAFFDGTREEYEAARDEPENDGGGGAAVAPDR